MFSKNGNVGVSASYFEGGAFLTTGHVGCHSEVVDKFILSQVIEDSFYVYYDIITMETYMYIPAGIHSPAHATL